jgi:hypothetical protein
LTESLGLEDAGRFIALIQQEPFDYTKWRQELFEDAGIEEISRKAMKLRNKKAKEANLAEFKKILDNVPARKPLPGDELE